MSAENDQDAGQEPARTADRNDEKAIAVCGVGASAGGIEALQSFFAALPVDLGLAYVVIVHLSPDRESELAPILARRTSMPVRQVGDAEIVPLAPDHVYVIAPDRRLEITEDSVGSAPFDEPHGKRAAIDWFFRSLAGAHGDGFAVVLSGSGSDGAVGAKAVKEAGGLVLVQDPHEAAHDGMPRAVMATGVADIVLPVRELTERLAELARHKERVLALVRPGDAERRLAGEDEAALERILLLLRSRTGHDFSKYKRSTVLRRLARRMQLSRRTEFRAYLRHIEENVEEIQMLFDDLLISVTSFFRDPEAWDALQAQVVAPLVARADAREPIRVWVPGCATGEEAYTLAILFREEIERLGGRRELIIFGSDVDEGALATAREGMYPNAISADLTKERLQRYFRPEGDHYRVASEVRDCVVFASHSLLRDPPFSRVHLISCRNLLIYLDRELQEQVHALFHYACREEGYVFTGSSERASPDLFRAIDKEHRIFQTRGRAPDTRPRLPDLLAKTQPFATKPDREPPKQARRPAAEIHLQALERLAPPSLVVDAQWNVAHLSENAGRFLQPRGGPLARKVLELVRPELKDELRMTLHHAIELGEQCLSRFVRVKFDGTARRVAVLAQSSPATDAEERQALVVFLESGEAADDEPAEQPDDELVRSLREKLRQAEHRIESMGEDHDAANQELRAANEELQSLNEEYRSTTEELETSKEELQSINEELQTVNNELKTKLEEVSRAHNDLENLMTATDIATLFLDRDLYIKRFTPQLAEVFNVKPHDEGRPIGDFTHNLQYESLESDARRVLSDLTPIEREVGSTDGRALIMRMRPYRTTEDRIDGVVATLIDVTPLKKAEEALRESERRLELELSVTRRLHRMTMTVATTGTMQDALDEILAAAIDLHGADFGLVQLIEGDPQRLEIVAQQGFENTLIDTFERTGSDGDSASGRALRTRRPCRIEDIGNAADAPYAGIAAEAGYRAVQSTPLIDREGELVGVLSTHFCEPHPFSERDEQLADLLARQAADLIASRSQQERLGQLYATLKARTEELEASEQKLRQQAAALLEQDRNKEEFLGVLSHELRNPMAAIRNSIELLTAAAKTPAAALDERTRRALGILARQSRHMARLVDDLLDVTRINRGKLQLERRQVDLRDCVDDVVNALHQQLQSAQLHLELDLPDAPVHLAADPERLVQIIENLLRNAANVSDPGDRIALTVRGGDGHAVLTVRDTGIGIEPGEAAALFDPYRQIDHGRGNGGLGLGLTLVKRLVDLHGGTIEVHSQGRGTGSEFTIALPTTASSPAAGE